MTLDAREFFIKYWLYLCSGLAAGIILILWFFGVGGVAITNAALITLTGILPALIVVYGRQNGQGLAIILIRTYTAIAVSPAFLAFTIGLPDWANAILGEAIRNVLKYSAVVLLICVELIALYIGVKIAFGSAHRPQSSIAEDIARESGMPLPLARVMVWELNIWRAVARFFSRGHV